MVDKGLAANAAAGTVLIVLQVVILAIVYRVDFKLHRLGDDVTQSVAVSKVRLHNE